MSTRLEFIKSIQNKEVLPPKITIGNNTKICPTAKLGNEGFGFEPNENGELVFFPHFGDVIIGNNVRIGSYVCIDRGNMHNTIIEDGVKIDNLVHIAHNVHVGKNTMIVAGNIVCGSVTIGKNCFIGANSTIRQHLKIGDNVVIGMGSVVIEDVPDGQVWVGNPAKFLKHNK